jgi:hypothetical protein
MSYLYDWQNAVHLASGNIFRGTLGHILKTHKPGLSTKNLLWDPAHSVFRSFAVKATERVQYNFLSSETPCNFCFRCTWQRALNLTSHTVLRAVRRHRRSTAVKMVTRSAVRMATAATYRLHLWFTPVVFNLFCSRTPTYNFSSTLYPQSCWCIIQVIHSL